METEEYFLSFNNAVHNVLVTEWFRVKLFDPTLNVPRFC
jgi:hypothetical protein